MPQILHFIISKFTWTQYCSVNIPAVIYYKNIGLCVGRAGLQSWFYWGTAAGLWTSQSASKNHNLLYLFKEGDHKKLLNPFGYGEKLNDTKQARIGF